MKGTGDTLKDAEKPEQPRKNLPAIDLKTLTADARRELADKILCRYEDGEGVPTIAAELKANPTALCRLVIRERWEEWREVRAARVQHEYLESLAMLKASRDHADVNKWDKTTARLAWELERLAPKLYGNKQETPTAPVQININVRGSAEKEVKGVTLDT